MSVHRRLAASCAVLACALAGPAAAHGATLTNAGGTLTYTGAPGFQSNVDFEQAAAPDNSVTVTRSQFFNDDDPITATGCTPGGPNTFTCPDVSSIAVDLGDKDDLTSVRSFRGPVSLSGGPGDDGLSLSEPAAVAHTLNGGDGDDFLDVFYSSASGGRDVLNGGSGIDSGSLSFSLGAPEAAGPVDVSVSLDGSANDGIAGQGANFAADIEDASATTSFSPTTGPTQFGKVTITGSAVSNQLDGGGGNDTVDGAAGADSLFGNGGDDTINARDGYPDRVNCGSGDHDTAVVDTLDQVASNCESAQAADVGNASEDKPPTIAWTAPLAAAKLAGNSPTILTVNASDDKGVTQVQFLDDDRVVCTDTTAPYTCAYQARGEDVGRNTLVAIASDAAGQTASTVRTVTVDRFTPGTISLNVKPSKDKTAPYSFTISGKVALPAGVSASGGCTGTVAVTVKARRKTISTRTDELSKTCVYSVKVSFKTRARFPANGKLKVQATFRGNEVMQAKKSSAKTAGTK